MTSFPTLRRLLAAAGVVSAAGFVACHGASGPSQPSDALPTAGPTPRPTAAAANKPPTVTIDLAEPATAIWRVTGVLFRAAATDPDGDALVYTWDFGDGETTVGDNVIAHAFDKSGSIDVTLTVDDKRGGTAVARRTINVVRMSGNWFGLMTNGPHQGLRIGGSVGQAGRSFATNMSTSWGDGAGSEGSFEVSGVFFDPQDMSFRISGLCGGEDAVYRGSWNDRLDVFSGDGGGCGLTYRHIDLYR